MWDEDLALQLTFFFRDNDGATGKVVLHLPVALADYARQFCIDLAQLLRAVSNCALLRVRISMSAAAINPPVPSGNAAEFGTFIFSTSAGERYIAGIPGLKPSKTTTTGDTAGIIIDTIDSDVLAYVSATLANVVTPWNDSLTGLNIAGLQLRPHLVEKRNIR